VRPAALAIVLVSLLVAGCDLSSDDGERSQTVTTSPYSYEARVIRGWLLALDRMDYAGAAYYFAPGAIIDQGHPVPSWPPFACGAAPADPAAAW
jgi:hypothetical protein